MKINVPFKRPSVFTEEGAKSSHITPFQRLKRLTMACMLWEDNFYVDGKKSAEVIEEVCKECTATQILRVAFDCHSKGLLRHIPLFLIVQAMKKNEKGLINTKEVIYQVCNRPDQMTELLALWWKDGKKPLPSQLKKGLARAFTRFDEYQLAKYNRDGAIKLRDILFLCHARPKDRDQADLWKRLVNKQLAIPETWETKLSSGADKKESFQELLFKGKMGKLAILRNLRNMLEAGISKDAVEYPLMKSERPLLPFQFLAAASACPAWEDIIDKAMVASLQGKNKLKGNTLVLVDVSGSMDYVLSGKSVSKRMDAAAGLAILLREICENAEFWTFSERLVLIPSRRGMALRDAIVNSQSHSSTMLGSALKHLNTSKNPAVTIDRIIVITDEQAADVPPRMDIDKCYVINVGTNQNGIQNNGQWLTINGFSEACIDYIQEIEKDQENATND